MRRTVPLLCFVTMLLAATACSNNQAPKETALKADSTTTRTIKEKWHWGNEKKQIDDPGYAQIVKVGNTLYISGIATDDLSPAGISSVYSNLEKCLQTYGATFSNVVKETLYTTDIELMKKHNNARLPFYKGDYPAATWVQISRLYEANAKLEVDLIAEL
ncbi:RidA family protein [Chitinophaga skermanii]|nr:RidA family protein [Chitinophaga skermanii]